MHEEPETKLRTREHVESDKAGDDDVQVPTDLVEIFEAAEWLRAVEESDG